MKKKFNCFQKGILFLVMIFCSNVYSIAQSNSINISITGIEYDDPSFSLLKENLQKNKNVTAVKTSYDQGIAKISMNYKRAAQNLWDEVPQTTKQFFKLTTINDNNIVLESKSAVKQTTVIKTTTTTTKADDDCKNCYFNLCSYDGTKSFQGKIFKQINKDNGTYYYNCDNGVLVEKIIYKNGYGQTTSITNDTIIMSNAPIGTTWGLVDENTTFVGIKNIDYHKYTLVKKHITLTVNGKTYDDVLVVNYYSKSYSSILGGDNVFSLNRYYVKGVGLIKEEELNPNSDPAAKNPDVIKPIGPVVKTVPINGRFDPDLVGTWKYEQGQTIMYWKFNADGTYDLYTGSITPANRSKGKCYWGFDKGVFTTNCEGEGKYQPSYRYDFEKKNDPHTGKPTIIVNSSVYTSVDNKAPWK